MDLNHTAACNTDTSVMQTLVAVPLVSVLRRFDCNTDTSVMQTLVAVPLVSVLRGVDCDTDTSVMQTLRSVPLCSDRFWVKAARGQHALQKF